MESLESILRYAHIGLGFVGLAFFWIPIFARKGAKNHVFFGKVFVNCAYIVLISATLSIFIKTGQALEAGRTPATHPNSYAFVLFISYLAFITFTSLHHAMGVLRTKKNPAELATPLNRSIAIVSMISSLVLIAYAIAFNPNIKILLFALSPIGILGGWGILSYLNQKNASPKAWMYEHLGGMIGGGIAFHTAFAVFGSSRLFNYSLEGWVGVIPWILPTLIGVPASILWTRHYQRKFGELPA